VFCLSVFFGDLYIYLFSKLCADRLGSVSLPRRSACDEFCISSNDGYSRCFESSKILSLNLFFCIDENVLIKYMNLPLMKRNILLISFPIKKSKPFELPFVSS